MTDYNIKGTSGAVKIVVPEGTTNEATSLTFVGKTVTQWGEALNTNYYRIMQSFGCAAKETGDYNPFTGQNDYDPDNDPILPKDYHDLGTGNGINNPVSGQLWYSSTAKSLYVCDASGAQPKWKQVMNVHVGEDSTPPTEPVPPGTTYVNITTGDVYTFDGTAWQQIYTAEQVDAIIDNYPRLFCQTNAPNTAKRGDLWVDTDNNNKLHYRGVNVGDWHPIEILVKSAVEPSTLTYPSGTLWYNQNDDGLYYLEASGVWIPLRPQVVTTDTPTEEWCNENTIGSLSYSESLNTLYYCNGGEWIALMTSDTGMPLQTAIPVSHVGDLGYLPIDIKGSFNCPKNAAFSTCYFLQDTNGKLVGLRSGYNGVNHRVYYIYSTTGTEIQNNSIKTPDVEYRPIWLDPEEYIYHVHGCQPHGFLARVKHTNLDFVRDEPGNDASGAQPYPKYYYIKTKGTLDPALNTERYDVTDIMMNTEFSNSPTYDKYTTRPTVEGLLTLLYVNGVNKWVGINDIPGGAGVKVFIFDANPDGSPNADSVRSYLPYYGIYNCEVTAPDGDYFNRIKTPGADPVLWEEKHQVFRRSAQYYDIRYSEDAKTYWEEVTNFQYEGTATQETCTVDTTSGAPTYIRLTNNNLGGFISNPFSTWFGSMCNHQFAISFRAKDSDTIVLSMLVPSIIGTAKTAISFAINVVGEIKVNGGPEGYTSLYDLGPNGTKVQISPTAGTSPSPVERIMVRKQLLNSEYPIIEGDFGHAITWHSMALHNINPTTVIMSQSPRDTYEYWFLNYLKYRLNTPPYPTSTTLTMWEDTIEKVGKVGDTSTLLPVGGSYIYSEDASLTGKRFYYGTFVHYNSDSDESKVVITSPSLLSGQTYTPKQVYHTLTTTVADSPLKLQVTADKYEALPAPKQTVLINTSSTEGAPWFERNDAKAPMHGCLIDSASPEKIIPIWWDIDNLTFKAINVTGSETVNTDTGLIKPGTVVDNDYITASVPSNWISSIFTLLRQDTLYTNLAAGAVDDDISFAITPKYVGLGTDGARYFIVGYSFENSGTLELYSRVTLVKYNGSTWTKGDSYTLYGNQRDDSNALHINNAYRNYLHAVGAYYYIGTGTVAEGTWKVYYPIYAGSGLYTTGNLTYGIFILSGFVTPGSNPCPIVCAKINRSTAPWTLVSASKNPAPDPDDGLIPGVRVVDTVNSWEVPTVSVHPLYGPHRISCFNTDAANTWWSMFFWDNRSTLDPDDFKAHLDTLFNGVATYDYTPATQDYSSQLDFDDHEIVSKAHALVGMTLQSAEGFTIFYTDVTAFFNGSQLSAGTGNLPYTEWTLGASETPADQETDVYNETFYIYIKLDTESINAVNKAKLYVSNQLLPNIPTRIRIGTFTTNTQGISSLVVDKTMLVHNYELAVASTANAIPVSDNDGKIDTSWIAPCTVGATAPTIYYTGSLWYDTNTSALKIYNGSAWTTV